MQKKARALALLGAAGGLMAMATGRPATFDFDPQPRWADEPETEEVCEAIAAECAE